MTLVHRPDGSRRVRSSRPIGGAFDRIEVQDIYPRIRQMILDGKSNLAIALALGISDRTVHRYRVRHSLPNFYGTGSARER